MHVLKNGNKFEFHLQRSRISLDHFGNFRTHVHGERFGSGGEFASRIDGRVQLNRVVRIQTVTDAMMNLLTFGNYNGDGAQCPEMYRTRRLLKFSFSLNLKLAKA